MFDTSKKQSAEFYCFIAPLQSSAFRMQYLIQTISSNNDLSGQFPYYERRFVKLSLRLINHHDMKPCGGVEV
jgi:hypothetical protein